MQKREIYVPKAYTLRKNYSHIFTCNYTAVVTYLSQPVWNICPGIIPVITTGYVDCFGSSRSLPGALWRRGARSQLPASCVWHWEHCTDTLWTSRETTWEVVEGRRRSHVFHTDCTRLDKSVYRGKDNDSETQSWITTGIQLRTRHGIKTRFIFLFSFFFFQLEGSSRSLLYFNLNVAFECD